MLGIRLAKTNFEAIFDLFIFVKVALNLKNSNSSISRTFLTHATVKFSFNLFPLLPFIMDYDFDWADSVNSKPRSFSCSPDSLFFKKKIEIFKIFKYFGRCNIARKR